jgi:hypothetical protein
MSHTVYAVEFEFINMYIYDGKVSHMHPSHVLMRSYPIDKSLFVDKAKEERRTSC